MSYNCEIKDQPVQLAVSIRTHTAVENLKDVLGKAFYQIVNYMNECGEQPVGAPYVGYFNMDMQNLDIEIGFPCARRLPAKGELQPSELPGGKVATVLHVGPYEKAEAAYNALTEYVQQQGYEPSGAAYEFYLNGPETPPQDLQTIIFFPLKSK